MALYFPSRLPTFCNNNEAPVRGLLTEDHCLPFFPVFLRRTRLTYFSFPLYLSFTVVVLNNRIIYWHIFILKINSSLNSNSDLLFMLLLLCCSFGEDRQSITAFLSIAWLKVPWQVAYLDY